MLFPVEHYQSMRSTFTEMSHDELDLIVMGQIMAHCYQSATLQGHHSSSPEVRKTTYGQFYHLGHRVCQQTFLFLVPSLQQIRSWSTQEPGKESKSRPADGKAAPLHNTQQEGR